MMLAFLIDQAQQIGCQLFLSAKKKAGTYRALWQAMRTLFCCVEIPSWEVFYLLISKKINLKKME